MSRAYVIEVHNRTAGIITGDERGFCFFSSERMFDSLEGRQFSSVRDAAQYKPKPTATVPRKYSSLDVLILSLLIDRRGRRARRLHMYIP